MSNIMSLSQIDNKTNRSGFDLSTKVCYTSKIGELLPIYCSEVLPGDKFQISPKAFTRTQPLNTSAYTRLREYYDFYFVPTKQLWQPFKEFITQLNGESSRADSPTSRTPVTDTHPYFSSNEIVAYLNALDANVLASVKKNMWGYDRSQLTAKLLEYLGYGCFTKDSTSGLWVSPYQSNVLFNPFPLLAYQKIYVDHTRNKQWETNDSWTYNVDYLNTSSMAIPMSTITTQLGSQPTMFDLRYSNWNQDFFMGLKPNAQFGSSSALVLPPSSSASYFKLYGKPNSSLATDGNGLLFAGTDSNWSIDSYSIASLRKALGLSNSDDPTSISSTFSILALRQAEAMQRWKEVTQSNDYDYASQINAHFGINVSKAHSNLTQYIGGITSNLDISEVVNTNLAEDTSKAEIAGKGVGATNGFISFNSEEHGYIVCIYTCKPILDYELKTASMSMLKTKVTDYAIPELDKTGMVGVPALYLSPLSSTADKILGYAPRYIEYKTNYDRVIGEYRKSLKNWVAPITSDYIYNFFNTPESQATAINWKFFKINPGLLNSIFGVDADSTTATDQLLNNAYFDVKAIRKLDYDGLPY